jgi:hypothetical protein
MDFDLAGQLGEGGRARDVPCRHAGTLAKCEHRRGAAAAADSEDGDVFPVRFMISWRRQAILRMARPKRANMMERIQKRMITWLSCQPNSSK